MTTLSQISLH